jgi:replicative DNA helicase Mcm
MARADDTKLIDRFDEFYKAYYRNDIGELAQKYPDEQKSLYIDWDDLKGFDADLADDFRRKPEQLRGYAEKALRLYDLPVDISLGQAHVRVENLPEFIPISDIQADHRGRLVEVRGTVEKSTDVSPEITTAAFECQRCGTLSRIPEEGGELQEPHECQGCERQGPFRINYDQSEFIDRQELYVKEFSEGIEKGDAKGIEVRIEDDITGRVTIGDHVRVTGIAKLEQADAKNNSSRFGFYLDGVAVDEIDRKFPDVEVTEEEKEKIVELSNADNLFEQLRGSVAPTVHGKTIEKRALVFQLFNGVPKQYEDGTWVRGSIHTLFISDPGTFIDRVLESAANSSPHAVEVSASETSATGLTTSAVRSNKSNNAGAWEIEAGPLIKADQGYAFINGIQDLSGDAESSVETVLTQQSVDASKATATATFDARTSIMALGRPIYGRFDAYEPIGEQIDVAPSIISAVDLLFPLTDRPDPEEDEEKASHTLQAAKSGEIKAHYEKTTSESGYTEDDVDDAISQVAPPINPELLRKYIAYAQRNCFPTLTQEAREKLQEYYVEVRSLGIEQGAPVPVSEKKLETLVRLSEASARARLSESVEEEDAKRAIESVEYTLQKLGLDPETGEFDEEEVQTGDTQKKERESRNGLNRSKT